MFSRYVIITPYFNEDRSILERCIGSVKRQTIPTDHIVVADGLPQDWVDGSGVRHLRLDHTHDDWGDTPRGLGATMAVAEGYSGIGFLDADNWLEPDHVQYCIELAQQSGPYGCDYIAALRHFRRPDESILDVADDPVAFHIDTNCFFFFRSGFHLLPVWAMLPREVSVACDRVFYHSVKTNGLRRTVAARKTVNYNCKWAMTYRLAGEIPPRGAKPHPDHRRVVDWICQLSERERSEINLRIRANIADVFREISTSERKHALAYYLERAQMNIHPLELYTVLREAVILQNLLGFPPDDILAICLRASDALPNGAAEVLCWAARCCRLLGRYEEGYQHAKRAVAMPTPEYVWMYNWVYDYGSLEELARNALPAGRYVECLEASNHLLNERKAPADVRADLKKIADWAAGIIVGFYVVNDSQRSRSCEQHEYRKNSKLLGRLLGTENDPLLRARYTFYLALSYQNEGEREKALCVSKEAVKLHRELADRVPNDLRSELASVLNNLSDRLSEFGRQDEALRTSEEAVKLYRELADRNPDAFLLELASALDNLSNRLSEFGRQDDALAASEEAIRLHRRHAARVSEDLR